MAAALFRRGTGLCCIHREVCRLVWRPQTALFSSKPSDRKQPRRTHIKKAKPQPAVDIAKLLEQLFPQRRPSTAPPAARPTSSVLTKPPTSSSVPPLSKTEPAASSVKQVDAHRPPAVTVPTTSGSSPTSATSASSAAAIESPTIEANVETAPEPVELKTAAQLPSSDHVVETIAETSPSPSAAVEPSIETTIESPVEQILSRPVEPTVEAPAEEVQTESGDVSYSAKVEPSIGTTIEPAVEASHCTEGTLETRAAVVEGPVEFPIDVTVDVAAREVETNSTDSGGVDISHTTTVEPLIETTIEPASEKSTSLLETLENRSAVAEESVETTIESEADTAAPSVLTNSTDSGPVNLSHTAEVEPSIETTIEPAVEASHCTEGALETRAAVVEGPVESQIDVTAREVETNSTDSGPVNLSHAAKVEPLIETTIEPAVEASPVSAIEAEAADNLSHSALIQNAEESSIEPTVESVNVAAEEGLNGSEEMTLEPVTFHVDELLQTNSTLDEKVREPSVQTENSREDESETSTEVLSKWDSVSEDLHESEGESDTLVKELLCGVPPNAPGSVGTSSAVDPPVGEQTEEKAAMSLESITLAEVKAAVGGLEAEVLLETRNALEEEAEVLAKEEKMEVGTTTDEEAVFEETSEAEFLTLDSISEATDAIEAEAVFVMEAMLGSEQGSSWPRDDARGAEKEAEVEQLGDVLEATSLESVTLAEVQASSGTPESESLSETTSRLEKEAECVAGEEKTTEVEDAVPPEEETEASSLAAAEAEALSGGALDDLDPVQRLFLEKIKEYNMRRSNGGPLEAEPDYEKYLSEETTKLRRLYGGGDLSSFPQFTFTEPQLDQDSK